MFKLSRIKLNRFPAVYLLTISQTYFIGFKLREFIWISAGQTQRFLFQVHNKLGNTHHALMHFSWAMDLDPKGANSQIKDALDPALNRVGQER